jgi:hypothetical protein
MGLIPSESGSAAYFNHRLRAREEKALMSSLCSDLKQDAKREVENKIYCCY